MLARLGAAPLVLLLLLAFHEGEADGRRVRRRLSWFHWSALDGFPLHVKRDGNDDYYQQGVRFELFTRENPDRPELMNDDVFHFAGRPSVQHFDPLRPTKVVIHGWQTDGKGTVALRDAFLSAFDVNFILVNWTNIDTLFYPSARKHVTEIGQDVAYMLDFLRVVHGVPLAQVHLIGHSLGAHIAGEAGSKVQWGRVGRITGLDPAGPLFPVEDPARRLDVSDATFVDVIHTCGNLLGFSEAIGHIDFFPNGGKCIQPGCTFKDLTHGTCSHNRAYDYMEESISKADSFKAYPCPGLGSKPVITDPSSYVLMGLAVSDSERGTYCVTTRSEPPYALVDSEEEKESPDGGPDNADGPDGHHDDEKAQQARSIFSRFMRSGARRSRWLRSIDD